MTPTTSSVHGGRSSSIVRGHGFRTRFQCQIYSRYGHMAQRCYYQFNSDYGGSSSPTLTMALLFSGRTGQGSREDGHGEPSWCLSTHGGLVSFGGPGQYVGTSVAAPMAYS